MNQPNITMITFEILDSAEAFVLSEKAASAVFSGDNNASTNQQSQLST